jgi:hypothetical protein
MNIFYKLFPYKSLFISDNNTLTIWWVIITVLVFVAGVIVLWNGISKIKKGIMASLGNITKISEINDPALKSVWDDYQSSFIKYNGSEKTDDFASEYFNEKNLISKKVNLKLLTSLSSILVGLGILGTFVGLTFGISSFKTTSTEEIKGSIELLLSGMGTAFISSIYGMLLSLVYTVFERVQSNRLQSIIHQYCYKLDKQYKITKDDERNIFQIQQQKALTDLFYFRDDNENQVNPANIFRDIYQESTKQSRALQSFSTDLATKIEAGFESLLSNNENGVIPELQSLKVEIENLGKKLNDPTTEMTKNVVKDLEEAMGKMIDEFKTTVSGSTKSELEHLTLLLSNAGSALLDFPDKMQLMTDNLNQNFKELQGVISSASLDTLTQSEQSAENMRKQVEAMSEVLNSRVGDLQVGQEILLSKQSDNLVVSDRLLKAYNQSIEKMNGLSNDITKSVREFTNVQEELSNASIKLKSISETVKNASSILLDAQSRFYDQNKIFFEHNSKTISDIQNSLIKAKEVSTDYVNKFSTIQEGLKGIFGHLNSGLNDYKDTVGRSLETYLSKYTESLTKTAGSLASAASKQEDILEELTEQLSKLNARKY